MSNSAVVKATLLLVVITFAAQRPADGLAKEIGQQGPQRFAQQEVNCPVANVRTEITTKLPEPWWTTPQVGKLESVEVLVIGGKKTLSCQYWAYGTKVGVVRLFPEGAHECTAAGNHFVCR
jgi:hypothetical protein